MKRDSVKANFIYNMVYQVLNMILPFITTPYIARVLGAEKIGTYSYTYSFISAFVMFGTMGVGTYGQREIAATGEDAGKRRIVFWEIQLVKTTTMCAVFLVYLFFALTYREYSFFFMIQSPYFLSAILDISWLYQGIENFKYVALRNIMVKLVCLLCIFLLVKSPESLPVYLLILCLSQLFGNLIMWRKVPQLVGMPYLSTGAFAKHISSILLYFIPTISYQIYAVLDKAMLGIIGADLSENGYYEQAHKIINMLTIVITSYTVVMRSRMTVFFTQKNTEQIKSHMIDSLHFIGFMVFPMSFGIFAVAEGFVPWFYGPGYDKIVILLRLFSPFFIIHSVASCLGTHYFTPSGNQAQSNIGQCTAAGANVIMNAILIPKLGSVGATIASVSSEMLIVIIYMLFTKEYVRYSTLVTEMWKYALAAAIMFFPVLGASSILPPTVAGTFGSVCIGALVYFASLFVLRDRYMRNYLETFVNKIKKIGK